MGDISDKRFHQSISVMESKYQGHFSRNTMVDYPQVVFVCIVKRITYTILYASVAENTHAVGIYP